MRLRNLLIACCVLFSAVSPVAQSAETAADPISGMWTGSMGRSGETNRQPMNVELKFDGKAAISGTITGPPYPGDIKTGTFDPKTGALKLEVVVRNDERTGVVFEGTVVQGTATGRVMFDNRTGNFIITKGAGTPAGAQQPRAGEMAPGFLHGFTEVSGWVIKAAELVPADKYSYRPAASVRSFGQQIAHIADSYNYFCATAAGRKVQWSDAIEKGSTDKAALVQKLKQSTGECSAAYVATGHAAPLMANIAHTNLHYGNIITYMRMLGLVPPSS
jgi:uncharacterized damage-inducible protein DinB